MTAMTDEEAMAARMDRIIELVAEGKHVLWVMTGPVRWSIETMEMVARALHDRRIDFTVAWSRRKIRVGEGVIEFAFWNEQVRGLRPDAVIGNLSFTNLMGVEVIP